MRKTFALPALLTILLLVPVAAAFPSEVPEVDPPVVAQSNCTANAVSNPMGCVAAVQKAASCKVYLIGAPPSFIVFPDPPQFIACIQASHL